jgi:phospholipase/carboxylesterase
MSLNSHANGRLLQAGTPLAEAAGAVILLHGRGGSAEDILSLAGAIGHPGLAYLAPEAAGRTWYPNSFLAPRAVNEPYLSSALARIEEVVKLTGLPTEKIVIAGFSQGACLSTEFVATHPARYAGLIAFTGGLIGPLGESVAHTGHLAGTPALFLSGDPDPHVPWSRVEESAAVLESMGAAVDSKRYPGRPHTVSAEELTLAKKLIANSFALTASSR